MTTPFRARVRPTLPPAAQELVDEYEATYGSSGPGCCPEALAAVLDLAAAKCEVAAQLTLHALADALRGEG